MASARLRERVVTARATAAARLAGTDWTRNADVSGAWLRTGALRLPSAAVGALDRGVITMRGYVRTPPASQGRVSSRCQSNTARAVSLVRF